MPANDISFEMAQNDVQKWNWKRKKNFKKYFVYSLYSLFICHLAAQVCRQPARAHIFFSELIYGIS